MPDYQPRIEWQADDLCILLDEMQQRARRLQYPAAVQTQINTLLEQARELAKLLDI